MGPTVLVKCPLFGGVRYSEVFKVQYLWESSWYIAHCPLYSRCPLFGVSAKRGSTVVSDSYSFAPSIWSGELHILNAGVVRLKQPKKQRKDVQHEHVVTLLTCCLIEQATNCLSKNCCNIFCWISTAIR